MLGKWQTTLQKFCCPYGFGNVVEEDQKLRRLPSSRGLFWNEEGKIQETVSGQHHFAYGELNVRLVI
jgi:hypothetical protein